MWWVPERDAVEKRGLVGGRDKERRLKKKKKNVLEGKAEKHSMNDKKKKKTGGEWGGKDAVGSLRAYAAGIRPNGTLGEAGLTNPSRSSSPGIWTAHSTLLSTHTLTLNLLNLTRFQVISRHFTLAPNASPTSLRCRSLPSELSWLGRKKKRK